jgi:hypothetical protein
MNKQNYKRFIVSRNHLWCEGISINSSDLIMSSINPEDWGMRKYQITYDYSLFLTGYSLYPLDNLNYLKCNKSYSCPWVNNEWLPFWGDTNIKKSKFLEHLIKKFKIEKYFNNSIILYKLNFPNDIIKYILNYI